MNALQMVYYHFDIRPYSKSVSRSLKKEPKIYLYDWTEIEKEGPRFENMIAGHLLKLVHFYNDTGQAQLGLHYLRNKDGKEVDFLVTQKNKPLFMVEAKLNDIGLDRSYQAFNKKWKIPHFQIVSNPDFFRDHDDGVAVVSFNKFFSNLP